MRPLDPFSRILIAAAGLCLVTPASGFGYGYGAIINLTGLVLGVALIGRESIGARYSRLR